MQRLSSKAIAKLAMGSIQIALGAAFFGLIGSMSNTSTTLSYAMGAASFLAGAATIWNAFQPPSPHISTLPAPSSDVLALISSGKVLAAIKAYRKQTGARLKDAKKIIEGRVTSLPDTHPTTAR
ncbi:hypothetical protein WAE56_14640 [Iodobacter sp. LRB]|uniref:hypothetical protein n=1 Tax=Iodobacter sp. LRB TaxID=3127955 RepID=UPI00307CDC4A